MSPARSSVQAFKVAPQGAGFRLADDKSVLTDGVLATGVRFGPDGALYLADWILSFEPKGRGRVWKLDIPGGATSAARVGSASGLPGRLREPFNRAGAGAVG